MHCSLKGLVVKNLYPNNAMRFMADCDVLFFPKKQKKLQQWFKCNNVEVEYYKIDKKSEKEDSVYFGQEFHFELHYSLLDRGSYKEPWYKYFSNPYLKKRLIHLQGSEYQMSNEDLYLFFLVHAYRHSSFICDIRGLIDCYLLNKYFTYDRVYVETKLQEFNLLDFEFQIRTVSQKLFERKPLSIEEEEFFILCADNKTFGEKAVNDLRKISKNVIITESARKKAILQVFLVPINNVRGCYPLIYYSIILIPFYYLFHIVKRLIRMGETKNMIKQYSEAGR